MSENNINKGNARRKLLKGIAAGSGAVLAGRNLPDSWSRPVVDAVMLPAHAQTSMSSFSGSNSNEQGSIAPDSKFARALDAMVNEANADVIEVIFTAETCIQQSGDGTVRVDSILGDTNGNITPMKLNAQNVTVGGSAVVMSGSICIPEMNSMLDRLGLIKNAHAGLVPEDVQVRIDSIEGRALGQYLITYDGAPTIEIDLPVGECTPPDCPILKPI